MSIGQTSPAVSTDRAVHQVAAADGTPYQGHLTDSVWVTVADPYLMTEGNNVVPYTTGKAYFSALAAAIQSATSSVCMLGWQINWDVLLEPGVRLYDALLNAARSQPALKIYVLPWAGDSNVPTFVQETIDVVESINELLGARTPQSRRAFAVGAAPYPEPSAGLDRFFSHHQKQVVIDQRIAFVGGIDVAYGRSDDENFGLNAEGRHGNDSYNGCLPHLRQVVRGNYVDSAHVRMPDTSYVHGMTIRNERAIQAKAALRSGKVQYPVDGTEIDGARQPRMPWQDLQLRIEGPAVADLVSNFVLRWNSASPGPRLPLPARPVSVRGGCQVQMLRSASGKMVGREESSVTAEERTRVHSRFIHNHIYHAMVRLIEKADHFIYIENQFFVSAFGNERFGDGVPRARMSAAMDEADGTGFLGFVTTAAPGNSEAPPANLICAALGNKVRSVIMDSAHPAPDGQTSRFHIYVTLPVHSEGMLNNISTMTQVHYTMQSLVFGEQSLVNRIRRAILARRLWEQSDSDYARSFTDSNHEYERVSIEECWPYVTLLNLRNWEKLGDRYVTEQIYVHTKLMIVDDRYALVGSANINDRSQLGTRDSELAVLVVDTEHSVVDIGAADGPQLTRKFARDLRIKIWNKLFGLAGTTGLRVKPATHLADAVLRPAASQSWQAIQQVARDNAAAYEDAFPFIPRNVPHGAAADARAASIWPTKFIDGQRVRDALMPFDNAFWTAPRHTSAAEGLTEITGFISMLPWNWTAGENNNSGYHSALFVDRGREHGTTADIEQELALEQDRPTGSRESAV